MSAYNPAARTRTAARIVGPYLVVMGGMLVVRAPEMALMLPAFMQDGPLVLAAGAFTLLAGLTLLAFHHDFGSPVAAAITLIGIAGALKGAWLLVAPQLGAPLTAAVVRASPALIVIALVMIVVGAWLSFVGWLSNAA